MQIKSCIYPVACIIIVMYVDNDGVRHNCDELLAEFELDIAKDGRIDLHHEGYMSSFLSMCYLNNTKTASDLEQPIGKESQSGMQRLNLKRMRWRESNGAHVSTGSGCLQHTLGMLGEATTFVEGRWCTPYKRSGNSSALNLTT